MPAHETPVPFEKEWEPGCDPYKLLQRLLFLNPHRSSLGHRPAYHPGHKQNHPFVHNRILWHIVQYCSCKDRETDWWLWQPDVHYPPQNPLR